MADEEKNVCKNCMYFSRGLIEGGYCKLYRHNLSMPERICSRFEPRSETARSETGDETDEAIEKSTGKYKRSKRLAYLIGVVCTIILSVVLLLIGVIFASVVIVQDVTVPVKLGTMAVALSVFFLLVWHLVIFLRRRRQIYIAYLVLTLVIAALLLADFGNVWLALNNEITRVIEFVYYGKI